MNTRRRHIVVPVNGLMHGFTLLELLVVVSIMVLVFGISIASFNTFNKRERLQQAALNFKTALRYAQTRALSADKPSNCDQSDTFVGMHVDFPNTGTYTVTHECSSGLVGTVESTLLPTGIVFTSLPTAFTLKVLSSMTTLAADQTIALTNTTDTYRVVVKANGEIDDLGFQ